MNNLADCWVHTMTDYVDSWSARILVGHLCEEEVGLRMVV